jgi:uncharacterized protein
MEEAERLKPEVADAEKTHLAEKEKIGQILATLTEKTASLQKRLAEVQADRDQLTTGIDEDVLDRYDRLFKTKHGAAVVSLEHDVCMGCHMKVTSQTTIEVKAQKSLVHCPQCGRILHLPG